MTQLTKVNAASIRRAAARLFAKKPTATIDDETRKAFRKIAGRPFVSVSAERARSANQVLFLQIQTAVIAGRLDSMGAGVTENTHAKESPSRAQRIMADLRTGLSAGAKCE